MTLTIVGLGPGPIDDLTRRAWQILEAAKTVYLRTRNFPCVRDLPHSTHYHDFDDLNDVETITSRLLEIAQSSDLVFAVPGNPILDDAVTRHLLAKKGDIDIQLVPGLSLVGAVLQQTDHIAQDALQLLDGNMLATMHHPPINPQFPALIRNINSQIVAAVKTTLLNQYPSDFDVMLVTTGAKVKTLTLAELDQNAHFMAHTALYVPSLGEYTSYESFQEIIAHLRAPEGCPWDREQTHVSLRPFLIEETYEVLDAIDQGKTDELAGELGDLLLQIVLHTQIATEAGEFYMSDVLNQVNRKMIRRHPHVWGTVDVDGDSSQVTQNWEAIKKAEKAANGEAPKGYLDSIPHAGPALWVAHKYQHKVAKVGFDWPDISGVEDKIREELQEILEAPNNEEKALEIGDLIFVMVNWLRWLGVEDPESLVRNTNRKFYNRFSYIEKQAAAQGRDLQDMSLADMDVLWDEAKAQGL